MYYSATVFRQTLSDIIRRKVSCKFFSNKLVGLQTNFTIAHCVLVGTNADGLFPTSEDVWTAKASVQALLFLAIAEEFLSFAQHYEWISIITYLIIGTYNGNRNSTDAPEEMTKETIGAWTRDFISPGTKLWQIRRKLFHFR